LRWRRLLGDGQGIADLIVPVTCKQVSQFFERNTNYGMLVADTLPARPALPERQLNDANLVLKVMPPLLQPARKGGRCGLPE
jgi:hypothetical protein